MAGELLPRLAAVGAGRMGRGIATAFAYAGHRITLVDLRRRSAGDHLRLRTEALAEVRANAQALAQLGALPADWIEPLVERVAVVDADAAPTALAAAELVFEGVPETMAAKRDAFDAINAHCREDAIVTSTTSSILVTQLAPLLRCPQRFLNMHWLNPAYLIPVVELSTHPGTDAGVVARTKARMEAIGKLPVVCGPAPGYIVPRLQALVMNEAARMVEEGVATPQEIDKATRYGMGLRFAAIGVVEFIDFGGIDILHHASRELSESVDATRYRAPALVDRLVGDGHLGLKTASGFYDYTGCDLAGYRRDVLSRVLQSLRSAGLWREPSARTVD